MRPRKFKPSDHEWTRRNANKLWLRMKHGLNAKNQRRRRGIFVVVTFENPKLRRSGIVGEYVAPTELVDFSRAVLQICRAYGAGKKRGAAMAKVPPLVQDDLDLKGFNIMCRSLFSEFYRSLHEKHDN